MKILHVCNHFYPCIGGMERYVLDLCTELIKKGHRSDVICLNTCAQSKEILPARETIDGIAVHRVPYASLKYYKIALSVLKFVKDYDIIHIHGIGFFSDFLSVTKIFHKKPMILSTHGGIFATKNINAIKKIYFSTAVKLALKNIKQIIATGPGDYEVFSGISKNVILIEPGIDYKKFASIKRKPEKNTLLFVGRISKNKRVDNLIRAVCELKKSVPKIRLYVVGGDENGMADNLRALSKNLGAGENILFAGKVPDKELRKYYSVSQFFVSASEYEGFGISVAEAMAAGCIPILNDIIPFKSFVKEGENGFIADLGDPKHAADKILKIMRQMSLAKIEKNARRSAERYDWKNKAREIESIYKAVIQ